MRTGAGAVVAIYRYPIKGAEKMDPVVLTPASACQTIGGLQLN